MKKMLCAALMLILFAPLPVPGEGGAAAEAEVLRQFSQILDLWRDGRYEELYERTATGGKGSKEGFAKRLGSAPRRPACCWEKMQDPKVTLKGETALVRARLGFEGSVAGTEYVTKSVKLKRENGLWQISQSELFTLGNLVKKRARYRWLGKP